MLSLDEKIEIEKKKYLDFVKQNQDKYIYIYGAGKQAVPIANFLKENGTKIEGFCVTDKSSNRSIIDDIPVCQIDEIGYRPEEVAFIFGTRVQLNLEIETIVKRYGFRLFLPATELVRYFGNYGYDFFRSPMMEITTRLGCSVNCKYCPQQLFIKKYTQKEKYITELTIENFKVCIDRLPKDTYVEFAGFTEPFLNPNCMEMVSYAVKNGYRVNMFTTLMGLCYEQLEELLLLKFEEFVLHVPDEEGYSTIPITEEYKTMLKKLVSAKKENGNSFVDYACAQGNIPKEIRDILGTDVRSYIVLNDRAGNLSHDCLYKRRNITGNIRCELASDINHNVLLPDGRVVLCSNDWGMEHVLGNLIEQSYEQIMNGEEAKNIRKAMMSNNAKVLCRNCFQAISENE